LGGTETTEETEEVEAEPRVGPPMLMLGLGFLSVLVSVPLVPTDSNVLHVLGYVAGALVPILMIGLIRRADLDRRRSPFYTPVRYFGPALAVLAVLAVLAAGLHVWPVATGLAS
jgi:chromate transport protein ChrA